jgi:hypothetical protein
MVPVRPSELAKRRFAPTVPPTDAAPPLGARRVGGEIAAGAGAFTIFRNTVTGTSGAEAVEPTAANDRNGVIATGNRYVSTSSDNGLTFDTASLKTTAGQVYGGFCCDQVAYAIDRGDYSLAFWLLQDTYSASARRNALRLRLFRGRSALLSSVDRLGSAGSPDVVSDTCHWQFEPQDFKLGDRLRLDFNQVSHTPNFLYITTNVRDTTGGSTSTDTDTKDPRIGALIFRIALADLDDGDCHITFRYWYEEGRPYISPVQNAGSTMYFATRVPGALEGDNLRIYSISDSSTDLEKKDKDVANYKDVDGVCPLPSGHNPCVGQHDGRMSGFRSGNTIGWLWMGDQDSDFPFPHVRVAVFETGTLDKIVEHQIWHSDFAWQLPTVGVNAQGHLGVLLYAMGGGRYARLQGFILTNPRNWSGIQMQQIADSTTGTNDWGHYGSVRPYGNCPDTFLGSGYTSEVGSGGPERKGRFVWFGRDGDGCPDLIVTGLLALPATVSRGQTMSIIQATRNIGSALANGSTARFYLSRDPAKSADDILLDAEAPVPSLAADSLFTSPPANATIPGTASGIYHLLACADDRAAVAEITDTNNCYTAGFTITVEVR